MEEWPKGGGMGKGTLPISISPAADFCIHHGLIIAVFYCYCVRLWISRTRQDNAVGVYVPATTCPSVKGKSLYCVLLHTSSFKFMLQLFDMALCPASFMLLEQSSLPHIQPALRTRPMAPAWRLLRVSRGMIPDLAWFSIQGEVPNERTA